MVKRLVLAVVLLVALAAAWLLFSLDARVARAIEASVSRTLGTPVHVDGVDLALTRGEGTIRGLRVANPEGFSDDDAIYLEEIELAVDTSSLGGQPFRVTRARVGASRVRFEIDEQGASNVDRIVHHLSHHAGEGEDAPDAVREPQRIAIEALRFAGGEILLTRPGVDEPERVNLPALEMSDVGGLGGAPGGALSREIARALLRRAAAATAGHQLGRAVEKELGGVAGDVAESVLRRILE